MESVYNYYLDLLRGPILEVLTSEISSSEWERFVHEHQTEGFFQAFEEKNGKVKFDDFDSRFACFKLLFQIVEYIDPNAVIQREIDGVMTERTALIWFIMTLIDGARYAREIFPEDPEDSEGLWESLQVLVMHDDTDFEPIVPILLGTPEDWDNFSEVSLGKITMQGEIIDCLAEYLDPYLDKQINWSLVEACMYDYNADYENADLDAENFHEIDVKLDILHKGYIRHLKASSRELLGMFSNANDQNEEANDIENEGFPEDMNYEAAHVTPLWKQFAGRVF